MRLAIDEDDESEPEDQVGNALAAFGLSLEGDLQLEDEYFLWPENLRCFQFWLRIQTQWVSNPNGGRDGLNYGGVESCFRLSGLKRKRRVEYFPLIQAMEIAVLNEVNSR